MKKVYLTLLAGLFCLSTLHAQVSITPRLGVNFTKVVYGQDLDDAFTGLDEPFHVGLQAGLGADFMFTDNFSLYAELLYTQKGSKYEGTQTANDPVLGQINVRQETDITFNFLELPLLARYKFGDVTQFYLNAGPSVGYWLGGTWDSEIESNGETISIEEDIDFLDRDELTGIEGPNVLVNEEVNRLEIGASVGAGVLFGINSGKFNLDLRYTLGLTSIHEGVDDPDDSWKNNVLSVSIGYFFGLAENYRNTGYGY